MFEKLFRLNIDEKNNLDIDETKNIYTYTELINEDKLYKYLVSSEVEDLIDEECMK